MLQEARRIYKGRVDSAPFILNRRSDKVKNVVIPTVDRKRPESPVRTTIVLREWDSKHAFWTLDLNNKRFIVRHLSGGAGGGVGWYWWPGASDRFEGPVALSEIRPRSSVSRKPYTEIVDAESDEEEQEKPLVQGLRSGVFFKAPFKPEEATPSENENREMSFLTEQLNAGSSLYKSISSTKRKARYADEFDHQAESTERRDEHANLRPKFAPSSPLGDYASYGVMDSPVAAKRRKTDISTRELNQLYAASPLNTRPTGGFQTTSITQSSHDANIQLRSITEMPDSLPMPLSKYKQDNTKLRISLGESSVPRVKRFRACPTTTAFYTLISQACNIPQDSIGAVTVVFDWMQQSDRGRMMAMNSIDGECLEMLIEEVDSALVWGPDSGRCIIDVLIQQERHEVRGGPFRKIPNVLIIDILSPP